MIPAGSLGDWPIIDERNRTCWQSGNDKVAESALQEGVHDHFRHMAKNLAEREKIASKLKAGFNFVSPYALWERITNENTNGLIQVFPQELGYDYDHTTGN